MGREMRALGLGFDRILASPAARVTETIARPRRRLWRPLDADYDERIYLASPATLLAHRPRDRRRARRPAPRRPQSGHGAARAAARPRRRAARPGRRQISDRRARRDRAAGRPLARGRAKAAARWPASSARATSIRLGRRRPRSPRRNAACRASAHASSSPSGIAATSLARSPGRADEAVIGLQHGQPAGDPELCKPICQLGQSEAFEQPVDLAEIASTRATCWLA